MNLASVFRRAGPQFRRWLADYETVGQAWQACASPDWLLLFVRAAGADDEKRCVDLVLGGVERLGKFQYGEYWSEHDALPRALQQMRVANRHGRVPRDAAVLTVLEAWTAFREGFPFTAAGQTLLDCYRRKQLVRQLPDVLLRLAIAESLIVSNSYAGRYADSFWRQARAAQCERIRRLWRDVYKASKKLEVPPWRETRLRSDRPLPVVC